jgi:hypothetical protein
MAKGTKSLHHGLKVDDSRNVYLRVRPVEPSDADTRVGEIVYWVDLGTSTLKVKSRTMGGVIITGDVSTLS